ncbi:MAG: hypothetical protein Q4G70_04810 [Pseudomonadota bacterium]|nr:hypothetical protein [Pseudomonadota bacterium]
MLYTYVFVGLTPSERALLESLFAADVNGRDTLAPVARAEDAHLIIVNGDDRQVVEGLRATNPRALMVLVGKPVGALAADLPVLRRPLEVGAVTRVLSALDWPADVRGTQPSDFGAMVGPLSNPPTLAPSSTMSLPPETSLPEAGPSAFAPTTASAPLAVVSAVAGAGVSARATWAVSERAPLVAPSASRSAHADWGDGDSLTDDADADVLVVVGGLGQRSHTLPRGIRRQGFRVSVVEGANAALSAFRLRQAPFVFLDQASLGEQLLPLARALTAQRPMPGQPPHVVVVARRGSVFDQLRARTLGCTWMVVPINRDSLLNFFAQRGLHPGLLMRR